MQSRLRIITFFIGIIAILSLPALADRTVIRPAWNLFTTQQDAELGRALADEAERTTLSLADNHYANVYIDALGQQIAAHAPGTRYPYRFKIVNDDAIKAYALPGGFIYVSSGLIDAAQNEPQLAGALAHEMAHIVLRHGTAKVSQEYANLVPNASRGRISVNDAIRRLDLNRDPLVRQYSRQQEHDADVLATQMLVDTGFDPVEMTQFFQNVANVANDRNDRTSEFFNDHPRVTNLAAVVRTELQNLGGLPRRLRGDSPDFHTAKDNLLAYVPNNGPSSSVPSSRMVMYRGPNIEFRYPDNWQVSENGDSISVGPDNGLVSGSLAYGMTISIFEPRTDRYYGRNSFTAPGSRPDATSLSNATNQLLDDLQGSNPNMRVIRDSGRTRVDGSSAMVLELRNDSPLGGNETDWLVTVLRQDGLLRYFVGVAPEREFNRYQPEFEQIVNSVQFYD